MHRSHRFWQWLVMSCIALGITTGYSQRNFDDVQIKATHVAGTVYMLEGAGGNIGVSVGEDGILIVDDQFAPLADKIRAALANIASTPLKFILNTHWHGDHTGGNPEFGPEAPIIAHTNVRKRLQQEHRRGDRVIPPMKKEGLPVITFDESLSIHFNGEEIQAIHSPHAHTDGDLIIYFTGSNVVHMGDIYFSGRFPFVDRASGGTVNGVIAAVKTVLQRIPDDARIIPGHGPLSSKADLQEYLEMLTETLAFVQQQVKTGKSLEAIQQQGLPERWASWNWRFISTERWIETLYQEITEKSQDS